MKYYVQKTYAFEATDDLTAIMVADLKENNHLKLVQTKLFNAETGEECLKSKKKVAREGYVYTNDQGDMLTILEVHDEDNTMKYKLNDKILEDTICVLYHYELLSVPSNEVQLKDDKK